MVEGVDIKAGGKGEGGGTVGRGRDEGVVGGVWYYRGRGPMAKEEVGVSCWAAKESDGAGRSGVTVFVVTLLLAMG